MTERPHAEPGPDEHRSGVTSRTDSPDAEPAEDPAEVGEDEDLDSDFAAPFVAKTFGGAFVWARGDDFVATVLRVKEGKTVPVATQNRRDMHVMLTGGRAAIEIVSDDDVERLELEPAIPMRIESGRVYRLIAVTEVELFTVYSPQR